MNFVLLYLMWASFTNPKMYVRSGDGTKYLNWNNTRKSRRWRSHVYLCPSCFFSCFVPFSTETCSVFTLKGLPNTNWLFSLHATLFLVWYVRKLEKLRLRLMDVNFILPVRCMQAEIWKKGGRCYFPTAVVAGELGHDMWVLEELGWWDQDPCLVPGLLV